MIASIIIDQVQGHDRNCIWSQIKCVWAQACQTIYPLELRLEGKINTYQNLSPGLLLAGY